MNRSFQAFAVLLVSLAGGMLAATWTSLPTQRRASLSAPLNNEFVGQIHCSCNPAGLARYEEGCARDKTTGERYGCGLGLGKNEAAGKSVISRTTDALMQSIVTAARHLHWASQPQQGEFTLGIRQWGADLATIRKQLAGDLPQDPGIERDYAAAELAAAGFDASRPSANWPNVGEAIAALPAAVTTDSIRGHWHVTWQHLGWAKQRWERQTRLWLVEAGLHRQWDDLEARMGDGQKDVASIQPYFLHEDVNRWFESFSPSVTSPDLFLNPSDKGDDPEENSRRIILATADVLETLSAILHRTAEDLARHAKQDVAELHTLKSDLEGRR